MGVYMGVVVVEMVVVVEVVEEVEVVEVAQVVQVVQMVQVVAVVACLHHVAVIQAKGLHGGAGSCAGLSAHTEKWLEPNATTLRP